MSNKMKLVLFFDEAFFRRETTVKRSWFLKGSKPEVLRQQSYSKIGVYCCVNPINGKLFSMIDEFFDAEGFKVFLKMLLQSYKGKKKIILVLDNAAPHKSKIIKEYIKENSKRIELLYLPPYSPDLQPAEMIWKDLRNERIHNRYFPNKEELLQTIEDYLKLYSANNKKFQKLCRFNYVA